jgi:hypothetical protein
LKPAATPRAQRRAAWQSQLRATPAARLPTVRLHIGELAVKGFEKGSERRIAAAFEREMHSLLSGPLPPAWQIASSTEAATARIRVRSRRDPVVIGQQLAAAVLSAHREDRR